VSNSHPAGIFIALVPWLLRSVMCRISVPADSLIALVASAVIAFPSLRAGRPKILELAAWSASPASRSSC
jgi:hypothetical protein